LGEGRVRAEAEGKARGCDAVLQDRGCGRGGRPVMGVEANMRILVCEAEEASYSIHILRYIFVNIHVSSLRTDAQLGQCRFCLRRCCSQE
jgi:hypothetical protein